MIPICLQQITAAIDAKVAGVDPEPFEGEFMRKQDAAGQRTPAPGYEWKNGKLVPIKKRQSVSAKIRQRKSTKQKPTRRIKGSQAP